jgi:hypothetical protein
MAVLSARYSAAAAEAQKSALAAAGEATLARGEDFTPGSFTGFLFGEAGIIAMSVVMLRGEVFGKAAAVTGLLGFSFLTFFTFWSTFTTAAYDVVMMVFGVGGGLLSMAWYVLIAVRLLQLGRGAPGKAGP